MNQSMVPKNQVVIEPSQGWMNLQLRAVWQYRELLFFLVWRDVKVRYKQTVLGVTWVVIQPVITMLVFSGLFGMLLQVPTGEIPYPVFVLSGLLPWQYFSGALNRSSTSLVDSANLVTKVYFPRLVIPLAAVLSGLVDFAVSFLVLLVVMLIYSLPLTASVVLLPVFLLLAMLTALGSGLWLTALNVRYRDVKHLMPFFVQVWMFLTPVVYGTTLIPENWRWLLALNPLTAVVEGFRWALLSSGNSSLQPSYTLILTSAAVMLVVLFSGTAFFRRTERSFADII